MVRFQRRVRLFPGVRLNFSASGVSATLGPRGLGLTVGPGGTFLNAGIPGSGLSVRQRIDRPANPVRPRPVLGPPPAPSARPAPDPLPAHRVIDGATPIASAAAEELTTVGMTELLELMRDAARERREIAAARELADQDLRAAERSLRHLSRPVVRWFTKGRQAAAQQRMSDAEGAKETLKQQHDEAVVDLDFDLSPAALERYPAVTQAFGELARSAKIWDVTSTQVVDRVRERTTALDAIERTPVSFGRSPLDFVRSSFAPLHMQNANGGDLYLLPGCLLMRDGERMGLVDLRDLTVEFRAIRFIEEEAVPHDAERGGHTWKKANKDGSRDMRFVGNVQIPIAIYGRIDLTATNGLREAYLCSRRGAAEAFVSAVNAFRAALPPYAGQRRR